MKKLLITSTALVVASSAAFADGHAGVSVSGSAEMGIFSGYGALDDPQFTQDVSVSFSMSGETDNGLTFGTSIALEDGAKADSNKTGDGDVAVFLSGDFGTLTLGDTDGAYDKAIAEIGGAGSINDESTSHIGNFNNGLDGAYDGQILRYDYSFADFTLSLSTEMDDGEARDAGYAIGVAWSGDLGGTTLNVGVGYQKVEGFSLAVFVPVASSTTTTNSNVVSGGTVTTTTATVSGFTTTISTSADVELYGISVGMNISGFDFGLQYSTIDVPGTDIDHYGISLAYTIDALTLAANYGQWDLGGSTEVTGYYLGAAYDLGGGASVHFGYANSDATDLCGGFSGCEDDKWSLGIAMSF